MGKLRRNSVSVFVIVGAIVIVTNVLLTTHKLDTILPLKFFAKVKEKVSAMFALIRTKQVSNDSFFVFYALTKYMLWWS